MGIENLDDLFNNEKDFGSISRERVVQFDAKIHIAICKMLENCEEKDIILNAINEIKEVMKDYNADEMAALFHAYYASTLNDLVRSNFILTRLFEVPKLMK